MRVYYCCSDYVSYRRAGEAYKECLVAMGYTLVTTAVHADLVVLHGEPSLFTSFLRNNQPKPGRAVVGYAVWETPELPETYAMSVKGLDAVWTCSEFSRKAFAPHIRTFVLPHVVSRPKLTHADLQWARQRLGKTGNTDDPFLFYTIVDTVNPRKNVKTLFAAFATAFPNPLQANVRLVVKQYRTPQDLSQLPGIIDIPEMLTNGQIAALHAVCNAYASAHHSEAWGLPLSEALSFGNPVIATGYSGNMEYMSTTNSFPVPYTLSNVSERMCKALPDIFHSGMTWASIDIEALVRTMRQVFRKRTSGEDMRRIANSMAPFGPDLIQVKIRDLIAAL